MNKLQWNETGIDIQTGQLLVLRKKDATIADGVMVVMVLLGTEQGDIFSGETWGPIETLFRYYEVLAIHEPKTNQDYLHYGLSLEHTKRLWAHEAYEAG